MLKDFKESIGMCIDDTNPTIITKKIESTLAEL